MRIDLSTEVKSISGPVFSFGCFKSVFSSNFRFKIYFLMHRKLRNILFFPLSKERSKVSFSRSFEKHAPTRSPRRRFTSRIPMAPSISSN